VAAVLDAAQKRASGPAAILVVDDRPEQRLSLSVVIAELGEDVVEAASGRDALRCLLQREFALILLDVDMPDLDGFETAALIRQRKSSEHTPIIFVTACADEAYAARGYELGAVDYIQAPVDAQVLKSKVSVFLELFRKREEASAHAASLRRHAAQLRRLADAAIAIHGAASLDELLRVVADTAAAIVGARQVALEVSAPGPSARPGADGRHAVRRPEQTLLAELGWSALREAPLRPVRMSRAELERDGRLAVFGEPGEAPPLAGWLAAPITSRESHLSGWIQLSEKQEGEFSAEDESLLVQLAQMASIAAENTLFNQARESDRMRDEFFATLSHELRTPLQAILSWSRLLRDQPDDPVSLARGLEVIERNARAQARLMEDLLDVSRIISNKLVLERQAVRLRDTLSAAVEDMRPAAAGKRVEIDREGDADPWIAGDPSRLRQVVSNLLSNAIKFTPVDGRIRLRLDASGDEAEIAVTDTGRGIAPDFLPHLFERFRQAESSTTRSHGGLGIGLAIVRHLVELQGGRVWATSDGEGRGATFELRFPLAPPDRAVVAARAAPAALAPSGEALRLDGIRVLLVEDEPDTRGCLALALEQYGAEVIATGGVAEALEAFDKRGADVLLSDLAMPGEDGYSLIRRIRARPPDRGGRIPAGALSAHVRGEERARAVLAGFDVHLAKPIEAAALAAAVRRLAERPAAHAESRRT
jgi:signal transduction histidine kinase/FixJ family two-component response regulator